jgi:hypothetical protein
MSAGKEQLAGARVAKPLEPWIACLLGAGIAPVLGLARETRKERVSALVTDREPPPSRWITATDLDDDSLAAAEQAASYVQLAGLHVGDAQVRGDDLRVHRRLERQLFDHVRGPASDVLLVAGVRMAQPVLFQERELPHGGRILVFSIGNG